MTTTQQPSKRCPYCKHKLVGTEIFRETCPRCRRPLKEQDKGQSPLPAASINKNPQLAKTAELSSAKTAALNQEEAFKLLNRPQAPAVINHGPIPEIGHDNTERVLKQKDVAAAARKARAHDCARPGKNYKSYFYISVGINALLLVIILLMGLFLFSGEGPVSGRPKGQNTAYGTLSGHIATGEQQTIGDNSLSAGNTINADQYDNYDALDDLQLLAPEKNRKRSQRPIQKAPQIVIPPKIEGPTPNPIQQIDQTGAIGSVLISSQPVANVVLGGKKLGRTPGIRATLPNHNGILIIGDNSTPFNMRFLYQETNGTLSYQVSSHPDCLLIFNGKTMGRTPQEVTSNGGIDSFQCELPNTEVKMKVNLKYTPQK